MAGDDTAAGPGCAPGGCLLYLLYWGFRRDQRRKARQEARAARARRRVEHEQRTGGLGHLAQAHRD